MTIEIPALAATEEKLLLINEALDAVKTALGDISYDMDEDDEAFTFVESALEALDDAIDSVSDAVDALEDEEVELDEEADIDP